MTDHDASPDPDMPIRVVAQHPDSASSCEDCASAVLQLDHGAGVQSVVLVHSATCPQLRGGNPVEVLAVLTPPPTEQAAP